MNKSQTNEKRRTATYRLACLVAQAVGVESPNSANGGREFDAWLYAQLGIAAGIVDLELSDVFSPATLAALKEMAGVTDGNE